MALEALGVHVVPVVSGVLVVLLALVDLVVSLTLEVPEILVAPVVLGELVVLLMEQELQGVYWCDWGQVGAGLEPCRWGVVVDLEGLGGRKRRRSAEEVGGCS